MQGILIHTLITPFKEPGPPSALFIMLSLRNMPPNPEKFKYHSKNNIEKLPQTTGVYAFKRGTHFLYIGKAINIKQRVKNHIQQPVFKDTIFVPQTEKIGYIATGSELSALLLEAILIKKYQPIYNTIWKDGKNYNFVAISKEIFPRVFITHQPQNQKEAAYIGPFVDGRALKQALRTLRTVFPFRTCQILPKKSCLYQELNLCLAPCILENKKEYAKNIKNLKEILMGRKNSVIKKLQREMALSSNYQNFEKARAIRDRILALENVFSHTHILKANETLKKEQVPFFDSFLEIGKVVGVRNKVKRIEGYDISNIQGQQATGSMVVFENGKPNKKEYRKFKIKIAQKPNDTAMIREVLQRRLKHKEWPLPQIIFIDGGKGQLNAATSVFISEIENPKLIKIIKIIALAKKQNELFIENNKKPILLKNMEQEVANLILQIRNEAHRFAVSYHRTLRKKAFLN